MTGGGGYFFALLSCWMLITTVVCRQKECSEATSWTTNDASPLNHWKGNVTLVALMNFSSRLCLEQTLRMDTLLQDLQDYGMHDLSFIVVNSKSPQTTEMFNKIKTKISFTIYQEQDEEQIWNAMDGETNDMFIYDRCGRLTYFIPFPLSDLRSKQTVIRAAVLSTYFRSPCGSICNNYVVNDVIKEEVQDDEYKPQSLVQSNDTDVLENIEDDFRQFENETAVSNETMALDYYNSDIYNTLSNTTRENISVEDAGYAENQNIASQEATATQKSLLKSFMEFFWRDEGPSKGSFDNTAKENENKTSEEQNPETKLEKTQINHTENETSAEVDETDDSDSVAESSEENNDITPLIARDVCLGVDENLCLEWSKSKLLHAQRCCLLATQNNADRQGKGCKNLGRKRCKKIQPILKCCLKTEMQLSPKEKVHGAL